MQQPKLVMGGSRVTTLSEHNVGTYRVVLNRECLATNAYLIDPSMFKQAVLRPFTRTLLAKTGDSDKHMVVGEVSVKHSQFADSGMITGLS
jgi:hypothetical protein|tara:strand:+ start:72 stop:344 length:273 start_codon:yes stop_codon:yes gene_type:complete